MTSIDDAGQLEPGLRAVDLRDEDLAIEVVELLVEDPDEPDVLAARVLEVGEPGDHLAPVQPVGAAHVRLAGLLRMRLRLTLHHWKQSRPATVIESTKTVS